MYSRPTVLKFGDKTLLFQCTDMIEYLSLIAYLCTIEVMPHQSCKIG